MPPARPPRRTPTARARRRAARGSTRPTRRRRGVHTAASASSPPPTRPTATMPSSVRVGGRHRLVGRAARLDVRRAPTRPPSSDVHTVATEPALVGLEHRPDDRPGPPSGVGATRSDTLATGLVEGERRAGRPGENVGEAASPSPGGAVPQAARPATVSPTAATPAHRRGRRGGEPADRAGRRAGRWCRRVAPAAGVGVHGDPPVGGLPPTDVPSQSSILAVRGATRTIDGVMCAGTRPPGEGRRARAAGRVRTACVHAGTARRPAGGSPLAG